MIGGLSSSAARGALLGPERARGRPPASPTTSPALPAGLLPLRRLPRRQPDPPPAGERRRARLVVGGEHGGADRQALLPATDRGAVPRRPRRRLRASPPGWRRSPRRPRGSAAAACRDPQPKEIPDGQARPVDRTALLVMDYQTGILARLGEAEAEALIARAHAGDRDAARRRRDDRLRPRRLHRRGLRVDARGRADGAGVKQGARARCTPTPRRPRSTTGSAPQEGDIVVRKTRVGALPHHRPRRAAARRAASTPWSSPGSAPAACVLSTVRDAHDRDYRLFVLADASADPDPEVHEFLIGRSSRARPR